MEKIKILFIGGAGRSGSTLLERILGENSKFACVGEITFIWERGFLKNQLCSCGKRFKECHFWNEVVRNTEFLKTAMDNKSLVKHIIKLRNSVSRLRYLPYYISGKYPDSFKKALDEYLIYIWDLYHAIKKVTQAEFIVDSSKSIHGHVIANLNNIYLYTAHLVRDGRAVVYSWSRRKIYEKYEDRIIEMPVFSPFKASMFWILDNISALLLKDKSFKYKTFFYEDFAQQPKEFLQDFFKFLSINEDDFINRIFIEKNKVFLKDVIHSPAGNPSRFLRGYVEIKPDYKWKIGMKKRDILLTTILQYPLLKKFGYIK